MNGHDFKWRVHLMDALYVAGVAAYLAVGFWVHLRADLAFPFPWNDEAWTLFPAKNVALYGRIWAPELNAEKVIFCYPVHDAFLGVMTLVFGQGLLWARHLSGVWMALAFILLTIVFCRDSLRFPLLIIAGWFFVSAPMIVAGNMVRPEALMMALASGALRAMDRNRPWFAMGLGAAGVALHPSGLVVMGFMGLAALIDAIRRRVWPRGCDWAALGLGALAVGYLLYIAAAHWADLREWYLATASEQMTQTADAVLASKWTRQFLLPALILAALSLAFAPRARIAALLAVGFALMPAIRTQMWYDSYRVFAIVLMLAASARLLDALANRCCRCGCNMRGGSACWNLLFVALAAFPMLRAYRSQWLEGPRGYPRDMTWGWGMRMSDGTPYYLESDRAAVEAALRERLGETAQRLTVLPEADMILMWRGLGAHQFYMPVRAKVSPDAIILRQSRYKPDWVREVHEQKAARYVPLGELHRRDETEVWTLWVRPDLLRAPDDK